MPRNQFQRMVFAFLTVLVTVHGEIVESGNHEELLAQKGKYYELYMTQYAGFAT